MKDKNSLAREMCLISGNKDLESINTIENFPALMCCTSQKFELDQISDLTFSISKSTGFIQIKNLLNPEILYSNENEYHGAGSVGSLWQQHHHKFAQFINNSSPKRIFEIGGGHGILAASFFNLFGSIPWTIIEPSPRLSENIEVNFIKGFFNSDFNPTEDYDTIIHSHTFEHIYDPKLFLTDIRKKFKSKSNMIFSIPNMNIMLDKRYPNFMNFEHTTFLSEEYVDFLLIHSGYKILRKKYFGEHSIFYHTTLDSNEYTTPNYPKNYIQNKRRISEYFDFFTSKSKEINSAIKNHVGKKFLFGAHIFAQLLIKSGLDTSKIDYLLDNDKSKHNKRLYGTDLEVLNPTVLKNENSPLVILNAGIYNEEIKNQILTSINKKTSFLEVVK